MPTGTPLTWAGQSLTAALANAEFRDQYIALYGAPTGRLRYDGTAASISLSSQAIGTLHTTVTAANLMKFTTAQSNAYTGAMTTGSTPFSRLIAPIDGIYEAGGVLVFQGWGAAGPGAACALLRKNGTTFIDIKETRPCEASAIIGPPRQGVGVSGGMTSPAVGTPVQMSAGDFIEIYGTVNTGFPPIYVFGGSSMYLTWKGNLA